MSVASPLPDAYISPVASPSGDMDPKFLDIDKSHMFRHISEIMKQLKGGYLKGSIRVPWGSYFIEMSFSPSVMEVDDKQMPFHPGLFFLASNFKKEKQQRRGKKRPKRKRTDSSGGSTEDEDDDGCGPGSPGEPAPEVTEHQWRVLLEKRDKELLLHAIMAEGEEAGEPTVVKDALKEDRETGEVTLDLDKLMITIIKPLQQERKAKDGIHIRSVLPSIFKVMGDTLCQNWTLDQAEMVFLKRKVVSLDEVRLRVRTLMRDEATGQLVGVGEAVSEVIKNKKSKTTNQLEIQEYFLPNPTICNRVANRILLVLKRQAAGNLKAELLVMRKESGLAPQPLLLGIPEVNQVKDIRMFHSAVVEVTLPPQPDQRISSLAREGCCLGLALYRLPKLGQPEMATNPISIPYVVHTEAHCCHCHVQGSSMTLGPTSFPPSPADSHVEPDHPVVILSTYLDSNSPSGGSMSNNGFANHLMPDPRIDMAEVPDDPTPNPATDQQVMSGADNNPMGDLSPAMEAPAFDPELDQLLEECLSDSFIQVDGYSLVKQTKGAAESGQWVSAKEELDETGWFERIGDGISATLLMLIPFVVIILAYFLEQ